MRGLIKQRIRESVDVKTTLLSNGALLGCVEAVSEALTECIRNGGKLVLCGNGGSASDALHFAGEMVGRFQKERSAWPAVVLNADVATMTAIANDYSYDDVFARQALAFVTDKDLFLGISTSGNSENVYRAMLVAKEKGAKTAALLGKDGGKIGEQADFSMVIPCHTTARIQESHIMLIHIICEIVEGNMCNE